MKPKPRGIRVNPVALKAARLQAGMSLAQATEGIVSRQFLYLVERGRVKPSIAVLAAIAARLGRQPEDFTTEALPSSWSGQVSAEAEGRRLELGLQEMAARAERVAALGPTNLPDMGALAFDLRQWARAIGRARQGGRES